MNRRDFFKKSFMVGGVTGASLLFNSNTKLFAENNDTKSAGNYDLMAIKGGMPDVMFDAGIKAFGGMSKIVKKGQTVAIKPNIGWNRTPEYGANTNPKLIQRIIEHCYDAGAKKVYVFDHPCDFWEYTYKNSGIESAAKSANATVVPADSESYYHAVSVGAGKILKNAKVHEMMLEADVFINVPILKNHGGARLTIAMKNLMGVVWDRGYYHSRGLQQCIADFCSYRKPDLNIVDAYNVMLRNGPRGRSTADVSNMKYQLISADIVAVDAAATKVFGLDPSDIPHIKIANDMKIGTMNLDKLNIKRITI